MTPKMTTPLIPQAHQYTRHVRESGAAGAVRPERRFAQRTGVTRPPATAPNHAAPQGHQILHIDQSTSVEEGIY